MPSPTFLTLPQELRDQVYEHLLPSTLATFADKLHPPALFQTNRQLRAEFSSVFYASDSLRLDAYYSGTDAWCALTDARAKRVVLESAGERGEFKDLADFWSLASARRYCQHVVGGQRGRGIMTVMTEAGFRRWMWLTC